MNYLIIESHPYNLSFNANLVTKIKEELTGHNVISVNLVNDNFNPVMSAADLAGWRYGKIADKLVYKYQEFINCCDILIFSFPVWWGGMPAILKGFCDKVFLPGWAYNIDIDGNLAGLLKSKKAIVITTMQTPVDIFENYYKNPINGAFCMDTLEKCGISVLKHFQIDKISTLSKDDIGIIMSDITMYISSNS